MPKTKSGEKITWKEFFSRWKKGIEGITPIQQINAQINFTIIIIIGIVLGLFATIFTFKQLWWLTIILTGALGNTSVQLLSLLQQRKFRKNIQQKILGDEK
jgi:hypothetical protein